MEFLRFIVIAIVIFYALKYVMRLLLPFAMRKMAERFINKAQQQQSSFNGGQGSYQYNPTNPFDQFSGPGAEAGKTGKIRVDSMPQQDSKSRKGTETAGEFIDFEEIK